MHYPKMEQQLCTEPQFYEGAFSTAWKQTNSTFMVQLHGQVKSGQFKPMKTEMQKVLCYKSRCNHPSFPFCGL